MMRVSEAERGAGHRSEFRRIAGLKNASRRVTRQTLFSVAKDFKKEAERAIDDDPKTGVVYYNVRIQPGSNRRKAVHQSSWPTQTHAGLSNRSKRSLSWKVLGKIGLRFGYGVAGRNPMPSHAPYLEEGTKNMSARPTLANAIRRMIGNADTHFKRETVKEFRDG